MTFLLAGSTRLGHAGASGQADAAGIRWAEMTVDEAIARASASGKPVLVDLWADWCGPCKRQQADVWSKPAGREIGAKTIPLHIDFESEYGQKIKRRYNVIGLPCVIVLDGRGAEVDRLIGYDKADEWLAQLRPILAGSDPIPALEARLAAEPESAALHLDLGRKRLYRGDETGAFREFLNVLALGSTTPEAAEVSFTLGRYYQRVREQPAQALPHWRSLARAYPDSQYLQGAVSWGLDAYRALGRTEEGLAWAGTISAGRPEDAELHYLIASWAHDNGVKSAAALEHARRAKALGVDATDLESVLAFLSSGG